MTGRPTEELNLGTSLVQTRRVATTNHSFPHTSPPDLVSSHESPRRGTKTVTTRTIDNLANWTRETPGFSFLFLFFFRSFSTVSSREVGVGSGETPGLSVRRDSRLWTVDLDPFLVVDYEGRSPVPGPQTLPTRPCTPTGSSVVLESVPLNK